MSNKTRLQTNNNNLQSILDTVNALPEAGGSGSGGAETVTVTYTCPRHVSFVGYINNGNIDAHYIQRNENSTEIQVRKNTLLTFIDEIGNGISVNQQETSVTDYIGRSYMGAEEIPFFFITFNITNDCTIVLE